MPKQGEKWVLKSDNTKSLAISYVNNNGFVGFSNASHIKRGYGTKKLEAFLKAYQPT